MNGETDPLTIWEYFTSSISFDDYPAIYHSYLQVIENWIMLLLDSPMPETGKRN